VNIKPYKIISFGQTRWCSFHQAMKRILQRWDALSKNFTENDADETVSINETMANPETMKLEFSSTS